LTALSFSFFLLSFAAVLLLIAELEEEGRPAANASDPGFGV